MNFGYFHAQILDEIPEATDKKEVARKANLIIDEMNSVAKGYLKTETVLTFEEEVDAQSLTFADANPDTITGTGFNATELENGMYVHFPDASTNTGTYLVAAHSNTIITVDSGESLTAETVSSSMEIYSVTTNYTFDAKNEILTVPDYVGQLKRVFENDEEIAHYNYEYVLDSSHATEDVFTEINRDQIQFTTGVFSENNSIKLQFMYYIPHLSSYGNSDDMGIPREWEHCLITGTLKSLFAKMKYRDGDAYQEWNQRYVSALGDIQDNKAQKMPEKAQNPKWLY